MIYRAKTLFSGSVIGKDPDTLYIGVPGGQNYKSDHNFSSAKNFTVYYNDQKMVIKNWHKNDAIRTFDDMQGRGNYKLAYFLWKPIKEVEQISAFGAFANMPEDMRNKLRKKLGL